MGRRLSLALVVLLVAPSLPRAQDLPEYGPAKGRLVIVGGGNLSGSGITEKFIELAGGPEKNFVIVPTAGGNRNADGARAVTNATSMTAILRQDRVSLSVSRIPPSDVEGVGWRQIGSRG